eukprot:TRINITY_DN748_c2_g1_i1.p1 TRINITY_DN748_c2_g1~~TRINITY_DN748_c2_g1_i1.p1  ORF type:complete len:703 (+),score=221.50 TRINITY_DN748_c2_g1_i1:92-2200(+)
MAGEEGAHTHGSGWCVLDYVQNHMRRDGDTDKDVRNKALWFGFMLTCGIVGAVPVVVYPSTVVVSASAIGLALWVWMWREITRQYLCVATCLYMAAVCYYDMLAGAMWQRWWPLFVLLVDVLLVMEAPRYMTKCVVGFSCVWLLVMEVEFNTRALGLFDVPDSAPYDVRQSKTDCARPPCASFRPANVLATLGGIYSVFLLDYFLTRGFADKALAERTKMSAAVRAAEAIAMSLARFDLATAEACLEGADDLPADLHVSLLRLLKNLGSYKPYLPQSMVIPVDHEPEEGGENTDERRLSASLGASASGVWSAVESDPSAEFARPRLLLRVLTVDSHFSGLHSPAGSGEGKDASLTVSSMSGWSPHRRHLDGGFDHSGRKEKENVTIARSPLSTPRVVTHLTHKLISAVQLTLHIPDLTSAAPETYDTFCMIHALYLEAVLAAASDHRGIVDHFTGASVQATFNASRQAAGPAAKALGMVNTLRGEPRLPGWSGSVVLGPAVVGVLGTEALRRPTVFGEAPELAVQLAAYARVAGVKVACNAAQYGETRLQQPMRVVMDRVFLSCAAEGYAQQVVVYEVLEAANHGHGPEEWMYELEAAGGGVWAAYNAAGRQYLLGEGRASDEELWARVEAAGKAGRRWDFAPRVDGGELRIPSRSSSEATTYLNPNPSPRGSPRVSRRGSRSPRSISPLVDLDASGISVLR